MDNQTVIQVIISVHAIAMLSWLLGNKKSIRLGGNKAIYGRILLNTNIARRPFTTKIPFVKLHHNSITFSVADSSKGMEDISS
jgi:hypothetical protein